ncbi:MAG: AmmeMemoRadiSam system protein A [Treponema sp.]|jgi:AmmeMemoRadiSam system protein A|nr:AmmeMemoRadiSam system protein A [Treponema sp.]
MEFTITEEEKKLLLFQARESIASHLEKRRPEYPQDVQEGSSLKAPCGAFVSLHTVDGGRRSLRGCIGRITANLPLIETVRLMAGEAAFGDPRFSPLSKNELDRCHIEISALSPMMPCPNPRNVKVGVHGLYIRRGGRSGVLLPQVPVEQGWNLDEYLDYICVKAGLPKGSCDAPDVELYTFTAIVFAEE